MENYVEATVKQFGQLDISAQIAGVSQKQSAVEDLTFEEFEKVMAVNVRGRKSRYCVKVFQDNLSDQSSFHSLSWSKTQCQSDEELPINREGLFNHHLWVSAGSRR